MFNIRYNQFFMHFRNMINISYAMEKFEGPVSCTVRQLQLQKKRLNIFCSMLLDGMENLVLRTIAFWKSERANGFCSHCERSPQSEINRKG